MHQRSARTRPPTRPLRITRADHAGGPPRDCRPGGLLSDLPDATLGCMVVVAVIGLIKPAEMLRLWCVDRLHPTAIAAIRDYVSP